MGSSYVCECFLSGPSSVNIIVVGHAFLLIIDDDARMIMSVVLKVLPLLRKDWMEIIVIGLFKHVANSINLCIKVWKFLLFLFAPRTSFGNAHDAFKEVVIVQVVLIKGANRFDGFLDIFLG